MRRIVLLIAAFTASALLASCGAGVTSQAQAAWDFTTDPNKINWVQNCDFVKRGYFDPIVNPGVSNSAHNHTFYGNLSVQPGSDEYDLGQATTNCELSRNRTSYWFPTFYADGTVVLPSQDGMQLRVYYRAGTDELEDVQPIPFGLRIIAGDANAGPTNPQSAGIAGYQCRDAGGNTVAKQATPPNCPAGDYLEASVTFPNCWDGVNLDSTNHKSHMTYADNDEACPSSHPVRLPRLVEALRFPTDAFLNKDLTLASNVSWNGNDPNSEYKLHADALFAWDPATMDELIEHCIQASIACEGVRDDRLPPSMNGQLPPDETPEGPNSFTFSSSTALAAPVKGSGLCHIS
jgi:hypothetical protein